MKTLWDLMAIVGITSLLFSSAVIAVGFVRAGVKKHKHSPFR